MQSIVQQNPQNKQYKKQLIDEISRLQQDFQALTQRSNSLQHQNQYFQTQVQQLQRQLQIKNQSIPTININQKLSFNQYQWPLYIRIQGQELPQQLNQYIKFKGDNGKFYVQSLQLVQYIQISPDGKSKKIIKQQYVIVHQPLQMFEEKHGSFQEMVKKLVNTSQDKNLGESGKMEKNQIALNKNNQKIQQSIK